MRSHEIHINIINELAYSLIGLKKVMRIRRKIVDTLENAGIKVRRGLLEELRKSGTEVK